MVMDSKNVAMASLDKNFWDERWKAKDTGWDMRAVSPPLKAYIDQLPNKDIAILIPGCGNAYEAAYLMENGFTNVTLIDIAPTLVQELLKKFERYAGQELTLICGDFFKHRGVYDLILEQTFFCALLPALRTQYVQHMHSLLHPGGKLAGLLFNRAFEQSPPFGGSKEEYLRLLSGLFAIEHLEECTTSIPSRLGSELFLELNRI
jgi:SAM-dependent methyltransferase